MKEKKISVPVSLEKELLIAIDKKRAETRQTRSAMLGKIIEKAMKE